MYLDLFIRARPLDWIKLETVSGRSNRTTRQQVWMSSPSSPTLVATKRLTCKKVKKMGCNTRNVNIYTGAGRDNKKLTRTIKNGTTSDYTSPEENFSMIEPILFLDMFLNTEWHPTRNSHFQKSRHFRFWRICATTLATIILFTKTIHFMFSSSLLVEETKEKAKMLKLLRFQLAFRHI